MPLREGRTLHHDVIGRHGAGKVFLRAAPPGTGIIAGGPMRAVFDALGMQDVVAKSIGSSNPYNMVRATFDALKHQDSPRSVAQRRNIKVSTLQARRTRRRQRSGGGLSAAREGRRVMIMAATKTIKVEQTGSPQRRQHDQRETLIGLGLNKIGACRNCPTRRDARHDREGEAPRPRGRRQVTT